MHFGDADTNDEVQGLDLFTRPGETRIIIVTD